MKKIVIGILMAFVIVGGLFAQANTFLGSWSRSYSNYSEYHNRVVDGDVTITINNDPNETYNWYLMDSNAMDYAHIGNYTISGNTITLNSVAISGRVYGTGTISGNRLTINFAGGGQEVYNKVQVVPRVIRRDFTTPGQHTFVFSEGFPATVEVYIHGGGGGGQGGHSKAYQQGVGTRTENGCGGGGGGGSAYYARFPINSPTTFNIVVGAGGAGGAGRHKGVGGSWESASAGSDGGNSSVRFGNNSMLAGGGKGGGGSGAQNVTGGAGGNSMGSPPGVLERVLRDGEDGKNGRHNVNTEGGGGRSGAINRTGSEPEFIGWGASRERPQRVGTGGGGDGGHGNNRGINGVDGRVLIIVTY